MKVETLQMDHLGLCSAMMDELDLNRVIDEMLPLSKSQLPMGLRVKAMVLNGLGFVNRALSLTPSFLEKRPLDELLGQGLTAEQFNDDSMGRCLDAIHEFGEEKFFSTLALHAVCNSGIDMEAVFRLDSTSFSVSGEYNSARTSSEKGGAPEAAKREGSASIVTDDFCASEEQRAVQIVPGYSKDHRPDLNQVMMSLITMGECGIPVAMIPQSGNASDKTEFEKIIKARAQKLQSSFQLPSAVWYADAALYSKSWIEAQKELGISWVTRLPRTVRMHSNAIEKALAAESDFWVSDLAGYSFFETTGTYADLEQRLVVVSSEKMAAQQKKTFEARLQKERKKADSISAKLETKEFACEEDARRALKAESKASGLKFHHFEIKSVEPIKRFAGRGRPKAGSAPETVAFKRSFEVVTDEKAIKTERSKHGLFVLVTNQMNAEEVTASELLFGYKGLNHNEKGFRFLKDDHFFADNFYVKKEERLTALMCLMTLCLLIYTLTELKLREAIKKTETVIPTMDKRKSNNPTARLLFHHFRGVSVVKIINEKKGSFNRAFETLNEVQRNILQLLGGRFEAVYGIEISSA